VHKLGPENPILHFGEVVLFEDEIADRGLASSNVRFRVMEDSFLVLLRSYVRVDHVVVRILDTRFYHEFGTKKIIRDFQHRESTFRELDEKGFVFGSQWMLAGN